MSQAPGSNVALQQQEARLTTDTLLDGIAIGASAGFIAGLLLGLFYWFKALIQVRVERREQIRHLAQTIEKSRGLIYSASDIDFTNHPIGQIFPRDVVRKTYLQWLHQQIQQILLGRATRLTFDEIQEIKQAFSILELHPAWVPNDKGYEGIFNRLESVEWLRLTRTS